MAGRAVRGRDTQIRGNEIDRSQAAAHAFAVACAVTTFYLGGLIAVLAVFVLLIAAERPRRHLAAR